MTTSEETYNQHVTLSEQKYFHLLAELQAAQKAKKELQRQVRKAEESVAEARRAHAKMVETLTETMRENTELAHERDLWKGRAQRMATTLPDDRSATDLAALFEIDAITDAEAKAIRKAIARVHHPDSGGNAERMKRWNAALDRLERRS